MKVRDFITVCHQDVEIAVYQETDDYFGSFKLLTARANSPIFASIAERTITKIHPCDYGIAITIKED